MKQRGIIPAGAGLTFSLSHFAQKCRDHPRGCGAHMVLEIVPIKGTGSSPRVRGSRSQTYWPRHSQGIIPAGAGLTSSASGLQGLVRDHPRGCGAHHGFFWESFRLLGSSPRVRGSRWITNQELYSIGIIPAGAGLTRKPCSGCILRRDHPRGCGAHGL